MKKVFAIALIVCIVNFILFGVSQCVDYTFTSYSNGANSSMVYEERSLCIFDSELTECTESWRINDEFPNIFLNTSGVRVIVDQWDGDQIAISADASDGKVHVSAYYGGTDSHDLTITAARPGIGFGAVVTIKFPQNIYENLEIKHGSGELFVSDLYARNNDISVGSGTLAFGGNSDFRSDLFRLSLTSGKVSVDSLNTNLAELTGNSGKLYCEFAENAQKAENFSLELNSGTAAVKNLSAADCTVTVGSGKVYGDIKTDNLNMSMSSGSAEIALAALTAGADIGVTSGKANFYIPASGGDIFRWIGSGTMKIDAYGVKETLSSDDSGGMHTVGIGGTTISASVNSGTVGFYEYESRPDFPEDFNELSDLRRSVKPVIVDTGSDYEPNISTASGIQSTTIPDSEITSVSVESSIPVEVSNITEVSEVPTEPGDYSEVSS